MTLYERNSDGKLALAAEKGAFVGKMSKARKREFNDQAKLDFQKQKTEIQSRAKLDVIEAKKKMERKLKLGPKAFEKFEEKKSGGFQRRSLRKKDKGQ